jgi:hypothetical protein
MDFPRAVSDTFPYILALHELHSSRYGGGAMLARRYLSECAAVLNSDRSPRERATVAGKLFWRAMVLHENWPLRLTDRISHMLRRLIDQGIVGRAATRLDDAAARATCEDLSQLVNDVLVAIGRKPQSNGDSGSQQGGSAAG